MLQTHSFHIGDTIFYVLNDDCPRFRIRKTRIAEISKTPSSRLYFDKYTYRCEDGYCFESVESLRPYFVYLTRKEAISFVIERLRSDLEYEKNYIVNVRQRLEQLRASLRVYTAASAGHENAPANMTYAYYIDDDDDRYVIRRTSLKRLFGDLGPGADFNALGCRDLGNGIRLSYICRSKEQAAYRITQFLRADIARQEIILATAVDELEQTRRSIKLYEHYLESD
jgi:hypothetical protein